MRMRFGITVLAIAALAVPGLTGIVSATTLFSDDFPGTSLDTTTNWTVEPGSDAPTVAGSEVTLSSSGVNGWSQIQTQNTWGYATYSFTIGTVDLASDNGGFGIVDPTGTYGAFVRRDMRLGGGGSGGKVWQFFTMDGSSSSHWGGIKIDQPLAGQVYDIVYGTSAISLNRNGTEIATESVQLFSANVCAQAFYYGTSGTSWSLDKVAVSQVPEPSIMAMYASGVLGLLCYAWRKCR